MKKTITAFILGSLLFSQSFAGNRICSGNIDTIGLGKWGDSIYVHSESIFGDSDGRKMCQISFSGDTTNYRYISGEMCKLWYSTMLTALISKKVIIFDYGEDNDTKTCSERSTWSNYIPPIQIKIK